MRIDRFKLAKALLPPMLIIAVVSAACAPGSSPIAAPPATDMPTETVTLTMTPTLIPGPTVTLTLTARPTITLTVAAIPIAKSGQLEVSVPGGISGFLEWKCGESGGLTVTIRPVDGSGRNTAISSGSCTKQSLINVLEYLKTQLQSNAPASAREWLDQVINEVQQLE